MSVIRAIRLRCWAIAASLSVILIPCPASGATGLFNLALLAQNRVDIDAVQVAAERALPRLTRNTLFANDWILNPSDAGTKTLRIILFRSNAATNGNETTKGYTDSCETFIPFKLIICDVHVFEVIMHRWGFDRTTELGNRDWPIDADVPVRSKSPQEQEGALLQLVGWVLGHEIGHITQKSTESTADITSLLSDVPGRRLIQTTEVRADEQVLHGSGLDESEREDLAGFLVAALNAELRLKYCPTRDVVQLCRAIPAGVGIIYDYNRINGLDIDASRPHPEFLLRLIRLLELLHAQSDCQSDGMCILLKEVSDRVKAMNKH
jgi:hypothetical protein